MKEILAQAGAAFAAVLSSALLLRRRLSSDARDRAKDSGEAGLIEHLKGQLEAECERRREAEERADKFAAERNAAIERVGGLESQIARLSERIEHLERMLEGKPAAPPKKVRRPRTKGEPT